MPEEQRATEILEFPVLSAFISSLEQGEDSQYPHHFDITQPLGNSNSLRYYTTHAENRTLETGFEYMHSSPENEKFRKWELTEFKRTTQLKKSLGLKYSYGAQTVRKTFAFVHIPEIGKPLYSRDSERFKKSQQYMYSMTYFKRSLPKVFASPGKLNFSFSQERKVQVGMLGDILMTNSFSTMYIEPSIEMRYDAGNEWNIGARYNHVINLREIGYLFRVSKSLRSESDWLRILRAERNAEFYASRNFKHGEFYYRLETDREFDREVEQIGYAGRINNYDFAIEYEKRNSYKDFYDIYQKEKTRLSLTRRYKVYDVGLFMEIQRDETYSGLQISSGKDVGTNSLPNIDYRPTVLPERSAIIDFDGCKSVTNIDDAISSLMTPNLVAAYSDCIDQLKNVDNYKLIPPQEIFDAENPGCASFSWFQSYVLSHNGYEAYPVVLHGTRSMNGSIVEDDYTLNHVITLYRDALTGKWNIMDYDDIVKTEADSIEKALLAYDPLMVGFRVYDSEDFTFVAKRDMPTFNTINEWIEDEN